MSPRFAASIWAAATAVVVAGAPAATGAAPRIEVRAWSESLLPPVFAPDDSLAPRSFPPDTDLDARRDAVTARRALRPLRLDGDLEDWRLARWDDIAGARSRLAGTVHGDADLSLRFALQWDDAGLWFAATLRDDALAAPDAPLAVLERVTLSLASQSPLVQRHWLGGSRSLRVRLDGGVDGSTDLRNRRREPFDAAALGVRAAVRLIASASAPDSGATSRSNAEFELFVPWTALYPLFPGADAQPLCNVRVDDEEDGAIESVAWSTRRSAGGEAAPRWGRLEFSRGAAQASSHIAESGDHAETLHEWLVIAPPGTGAGGGVRVRVRGDGVDADLRATAPAGPYFVRMYDIPAARGWTRAGRELDCEFTLGQAPSVRHTVLRLPPEPELRRARAAIAFAATSGDARFPQPADIAVRLDRAAIAAAALGAWSDRRYHQTGIVAHRMAGWAAVERGLAEAEVLGAVLRGDAGAAARRDAIWPQRAASGVPLGVVVLRGYVSAPDSSVQPYALFAPATVPTAAPLVVALHGLDEDESTLFDTTTLAAQCARRGFVAVCPFGRGNTGYRLAGERDVLDVVTAVRAALPIDAARLYATGAGLGGTGTWMLALRHPSLLAAAAPVSAYGDLDQSDLYNRLGYQPPERDWFNAHNPVRLARAGVRTAFRIVHGERDAAISPVHAHIMAARLAEVGIEHELRIDRAWSDAKRVFDAELGATLEYFARHARSEGGVASFAFAGRGGPICDVFARGPFSVVYGTGGGTAADDSATAAELVLEWRRRFAGDVAIVPDHALDAATAGARNLLLVGTPASNRWLGEWADRLPVRYTGARAVVNGTPYGLADQGVVWAAAHPLDPALAIVVCSGMRGRVLGGERSILMLASDCAVVGPGLGQLRLERLVAAP